MKTIVLGEVFRGRDHAHLINDAIGSNFKMMIRSGIEIDFLGAPGVIAWFVYMDSSVHGYEDGWSWKNVLTEGGSTIKEYNVSANKEKLYKKRNEVGYHPYRLAFQLDPYGVNNRYCCKFVGAFRLKKILSSDLSSVEYEKVMDNVTINSIGEGYNERHLTKEDFLKKPSLYGVNVAQMGFSPESLSKLKKWDIRTAGELLELNFESPGAISLEIREKIYNLFS